VCVDPLARSAVAARKAAKTDAGRARHPAFHWCQLTHAATVTPSPRIMRRRAPQQALTNGHRGVRAHATSAQPGAAAAVPRVRAHGGGPGAAGPIRHHTHPAGERVACWWCGGTAQAARTAHVCCWRARANTRAAPATTTTHAHRLARSCRPATRARRSPTCTCPCTTCRGRTWWAASPLRLSSSTTAWTQVRGVVGCVRHRAQQQVCCGCRVHACLS
jgi:hypothetical protein